MKKILTLCLVLSAIIVEAQPDGRFSNLYARNLFVTMKNWQAAGVSPKNTRAVVWDRSSGQFYWGDTIAVGSGGFVSTHTVYDSLSYANPAWITSLAWTKITGRPNFDSIFFSTTRQINDTTFAIRRPNNTEDTVQIVLEGVGGIVGSEDDSAFIYTTQLDDSTFTLDRRNGSKDTVQVLSYTGFGIPLSTLVDGATIPWDLDVDSHEATVTLHGNRTLSITNLPASVIYFTLEVRQDATGSRTLTLPAGTKSSGAPLTTTANARDIIFFRWDGATLFATYHKNFQ